MSKNSNKKQAANSVLQTNLIENLQKNVDRLRAGGWHMGWQTYTCTVYCTKKQLLKTQKAKF